MKKQQHPAMARLQRQLADTMVLQRQAAKQNEAIAQGARARLQQVQQRLQTLRPRAIAEETAGEEYLELVRERGALARTLGRP